MAEKMARPPARVVQPPSELITASEGGSADTPEGVDLEAVRFGPILGLVERLLAEAEALADWAGDGPPDEATQRLLFRVAMCWLDLENYLTAAGLSGDTCVSAPDWWREADDPRLRAFDSLTALVETVHHRSDWRKHLPNPPGTDVTPLAFDNPTTMGVSPAVFAKRLGLLIQQLNEAVATASPPRRKASRDDANERAVQLAKADPSFVLKPLRGWAEVLGCSEGLVAKLPLWTATMNKTGRGRSGRTRAPKAVSFTPALEAVTGRAADDPDQLERLIKEQGADAEPSPLDDDPPCSRPQNVKVRKRV